MKIKVEHISNTFNYGSFMMGINLIKNLSVKFDTNVEFYADCRTEEDLDRLKQETKCENIYRYEEKKVSGNNKISKLISMIKNINEESSLFKGIVVIGGDDISEYYGKKPLVRELIRLYLLSRKSPVFLVGQTVGPFSKYTRLLARVVLNKTHLYTRDSDSLLYVKNMRVKDVFDSRDLAFLDLPLQNNEIFCRNTLVKYGIDNKRYVTVVPSGLTHLYTKDRESYINNQVEIISGLIENKSLELDKIVLLSHVLLPKHVDDRLMIKEILNRINEEYKEKLIPVYEELLATEARTILGNGIFSITGRMHAAVSSYQMGIPSLALSYSVKYKGVLGAGLGMNELIIEANNEVIWNDLKIAREVDRKAKYIVDNYDSLVDNIKAKLPELKEKVNLQLDDIVAKLKSY